MKIMSRIEAARADMFARSQILQEIREMQVFVKRENREPHHDRSFLADYVVQGAGTMGGAAPSSLRTAWGAVSATH